MKLLGKKKLNDFKQVHVDARSQIESWEAEVEEAKWGTPHELQRRYSKASILRGKRVIFDICGNKYRLLALVDYKNEIVLVKEIGTHNEYDKWIIN